MNKPNLKTNKLFSEIWTDEYRLWPELVHVNFNFYFFMNITMVSVMCKIDKIILKFPPVVKFWSITNIADGFFPPKAGQNKNSGSAEKCLSWTQHNWKSWISYPWNITSLKYHILTSSHLWNITSFKYLCWEISYFNSIVEEFHSNSFPRYAEEFQYESWTSIGISKLRAKIEWKQNKLFKLLTYLGLIYLIASCIPGISNVMHPF